LLFRFIDTAGLRESDDTIESMGIERTLRKIDEAEIIIALVEATDSIGYIEQFVATIKEKSAGRAKILIIANKSDLAEPDPLKNAKESLFAKTGYDVLMVSATANSGIEELKNLLLKSVDTSGLSSPQLIVTNARHFEALSNVSESLERVLDGFRNGIPTELISTDIRQAIYHLGEITGQITTDEILGEIFRNFCIGK